MVMSPQSIPAGSRVQSLSRRQVPPIASGSACVASSNTALSSAITIPASAAVGALFYFLTTLF